MSTTHTEELEQQDIPTHEDVVEFYKKQNEILELRRENARLQTEIATFEADRYEAIAKMAHYQGMMQKASEAPAETEKETSSKRSLKKE
jgi:cell division protein FtsB